MIPSIGPALVATLSHAGRTWVDACSAWVESSAARLAIVRCSTVEELQIRLRVGPRLAAVVIDAGLTGIDRDLLGEVRRSGPTAIVVDRPPPRRPWLAIGASAVLAESFDPAELLQVIRDAQTAGSRRLDRGAGSVSAQRAPLVAVLGTPTSRPSMVAVALAQRAAEVGRVGSPAVLADLTRRGHQRRLHEIDADHPGLLDLLDRYRFDAPGPAAAHQHTVAIGPDPRGYRLLPGLRHHLDWMDVRHPSLLEALACLRRQSHVVVADIDADLEGEQATGSFDIEDRHLLARTAAREADLVVLTAAPGSAERAELHALVADLRELAVPTDRIVGAITGAARGRARIERAAAVHPPLVRNPSLSEPGEIVVLSGLDDFRVGRRRRPLPRTLGRGLDPLLGTLVRQHEDKITPATAHETEPIRLQPGDLGCWSS